jgi:hypothetical protein
MQHSPVGGLEPLNETAPVDQMHAGPQGKFPSIFGEDPEVTTNPPGRSSGSRVIGGFLDWRISENPCLFRRTKALNEPVKSVLQCFDVLDKFHITGAAKLLRSLLQARLCLGGPLGFALIAIGLQLVVVSLKAISLFKIPARICKPSALDLGSVVSFGQWRCLHPGPRW